MKWLKNLFSFGGNGGRGFWGSYGLLPGSQFDYRREAGPLWENSIVLACIKWASRNFPEAPPIIQKKVKGRWQRLLGHPAEQLLSNPNPFYESSVLWAGAILSYMVDGNAYWYVNPSQLGTPLELFYLPHFLVAPQWPESGTEFITSYLYQPPGVSPVLLKRSHVIHFRNGVDPRNTRRGLSDLGAALREVCADNEAATAAAAIMRNLGVVGISFTPSTDAPLTEAQREKLSTLGQQKFTGDRRGEVFVASMPGKFETIGFSPDKLALDAVRRVPEERITAALGIPAVVVGLGAGLERSTYSNFKEAREAAYESFLLPMWQRFSEQLTHSLIPLFGDDPAEIRIHFDISKVRVFQQDEDALAQRLVALVNAKILTPEEARARLDEEG